MRPLKLSMTAFGPYVNETVIDFEKLGDRGIYLITGDTGAGKTTIFDAICYALFGEASGSVRNEAMLRSKCAGAGNRSGVTLTFEYGGKVCTVERYAEYTVKNGAEVKKGNTVSLERAGFQPVTKLKEVNEAVKNILGLDSTQFRQIAMIAQGDFMKLLTADTNGRMAILQGVFHTDLYGEFQKKLGDEAIAVRGECSALSASIKQYVSEIACDGNDPLSLRAQKAAAGELPAEEVRELLDDLTGKDKTLVEKDKTLLEELDKQLKTSTEIIAKAEEQLKTRRMLAENTAKLKEQEPRAEESKKALEAARSKQPESEKLLKRITELASLIPEYAKLKKTRSDAAKTSEQYKAKLALIESGKEKLESGSRELMKLREEQKSLESAAAEKVRAEAEKAVIDSDEALIRELTEGVAELRKLKDQSGAAEKLYLEKRREYDKQQQEYITKRRAFYDDQAGVLAEELRQKRLEGPVRCPVCGAPDSTDYAARDPMAPTKQQLDALETGLKAAEDAEKLASSNCGAAKTRFSTKRETLLKTASEKLGCTAPGEIHSAIDAKRSEINSRRSANAEQISLAEQRLARKQKLDKELPEKENSLSRLQKDISSGESEASSLAATAAGFAKQAEELAAKLPYPTEEKILAEKLELEQQRSEIETAVKKKQQEYDELSKAVAALKASVETMTEQLRDKQETDIEAERASYQQLKERREALLSEQNEASHRLNVNLSIIRNVAEQSHKLEDAEKRRGMIEQLADTALGKLTGKAKIKFETFIMMTYFDRVIRRANIRLMKMTNGRYELIRRREEQSRQGQTGLELDVIDHWSSSQRNAGSLSGGEKFKASLSLALGLSDEVQSSAGGIRLDTMFVDEGFGSLDPESLQQAIGALLSLSQSNKLVGVISHVAELKEKIDAQIVVTRDRDGVSKADVRY